MLSNLLLLLLVLVEKSFNEALGLLVIGRSRLVRLIVADEERLRAVNVLDSQLGQMMIGHSCCCCCRGRRRRRHLILSYSHSRCAVGAVSLMGLQLSQQARQIGVLLLRLLQFHLQLGVLVARLQIAMSVASLARAVVVFGCIISVVV